MKKNIYLIGIITLLIFSCKKPNVVPPPAPDAAALIQFNAENIAEAKQNFIADANSDISVTGEKGTILTLPANSLVDINGNMVTGNVDITLIEVNKRSEMFLLDKPTNAINSSGIGGQLISGGEFYVSISQAGTEVTLTTPMRLETPANPYNSQMKKFVNTSTQEEDILWKIATDSIVDLVTDAIYLEDYFGYNILPGEWGWTNLDLFFEDPRPKTTIFAELPEGFNNTNSSVFIAFDGEPGLLSKFNVWQEDKYSLSGAYIPVGLEVHFIAVGIVGDELHYVLESATITTDHVQELDGFSSISEDALVDLIDELP